MKRAEFGYFHAYLVLSRQDALGNPSRLRSWASPPCFSIPRLAPAHSGLSSLATHIRVCVRLVSVPENAPVGINEPAEPEAFDPIRHYHLLFLDIIWGSRNAPFLLLFSIKNEISRRLCVKSLRPVPSSGSFPGSLRPVPSSGPFVKSLSLCVVGYIVGVSSGSSSLRLSCQVWIFHVLGFYCP